MAPVNCGAVSTVISLWHVRITVGLIAADMLVRASGRVV